MNITGDMTVNITSGLPFPADEEAKTVPLSDWERELLEASMRLYLGGKMIGVPGFGFSDFDDAAAALRALGHTVFNPAERDRENGFDGEELAGTPQDLEDAGFNRRDALAADMAWIAEESEGMVVLPTWTDSPGTRAEIAFHQALYLPVWELKDFLALGALAPVLAPLAGGIAAEARHLVKGDRNAVYGTPEHDFECIGRIWAGILSKHSDTRIDDIPPNIVAVMMMGLKIARLGSHPDHEDSCKDAIGYALCLDWIERG